MYEKVNIQPLEDNQLSIKIEADPHDIQIPSHIQKEHPNDKVDNYEEIEAEDYVSDSLIKESPVLKIKNKKPVAQFMMNVK